MTSNDPEPDPDKTWQPMPAAPPVRQLLPHQEWPTERPPLVQTAFRLLIALAVFNLALSVIVIAIGPAGFEPVVEAALDGEEASSTDISLGATVAFTVTLLLALLPGIVYAGLSFPVRAGHNWARVVITVFAGLHLAERVYQLIAGDGGGFVLLLHIALLITTLVCLYSKQARPYFRPETPVV
ncbi:hypothetical protein JOD54_000680 [Actinokineospora baliensis]|uniref:hypothetical protein n=1 Tax=Actinokineospora baliensis TaxID=547056 RepID=UPI0019580D43|nr:hypothetical protein [Actinokineospora baliensis]MBM7770476.1 hypothetical protein [Actinokineospora baliensis]